MSISKYALFKSLTEGEREEIDRMVRKARYAPGETIIAKGADIEYAYFIDSGRVKESTCTLSGKEIVFNIYSNGDCFGLVWALNEERSRSDFIASKESEIYKVRISELQRLMSANHDLMLSVLMEFAKIVLNYSDKLYEIRAYDVPERTRAELLRYASSQSGGLGSNYVEIENLPTHEEIANMIFTHREAVTREISNLKKNGVIVKTGRNLLTANICMLQKMVADCS